MQINKPADRLYRCSMPFWDTILEYTIPAQSASKARYQFFHEHLSETAQYKECFKFIKVKSLGKHMQAPTQEDQLALVDKFNQLYTVGDKIKVLQDNGDIAEWTVKYKASMLGVSHNYLGHTAVIWCEEHNSCFAADRVVL